MTIPAAPLPRGEGRRSPLGTAFLVAAFALFASPLIPLLIGPLALLLLFSRPTTLREWGWMILAFLMAGWALSRESGPVEDILRAGCLFATGAFTIATFLVRSQAFTRALIALVVATVCLSVWGHSMGLTLASFEQKTLEGLNATYRSIDVGAATDPETRANLQSFVDSLLQAAPSLARIFPGILALETILGLVLSWRWYHIVAARPLGPPPERFRDFRFNDHLVWGAILTLALALLPLPAPWSDLTRNVLVVWIGLYTVRGLAVSGTVTASWPRPLKVIAAILILPLVQLFGGILLTMGLADTWLDIRGRLKPSNSGGIHS